MTERTAESYECQIKACQQVVDERDAVISALRTQIYMLTTQIENAQGSCFLLLKAIEEGDPRRELQVRVRDLERIRPQVPRLSPRSRGMDERTRP